MQLDQLLNPAQLDAASHGEGPQLVLAGAGSGKTRVITHRIAWLIAEGGVEPYRIAAVTFTNKAAGEMKERVERLLRQADPRLVGGSRGHVFVGTFHRFALRLLRRYGERVGVTSGFSILDTQDQMALIKRAIEAEDIDPSTVSPRAALSRISSAKNQLIGPGEFATEASGFFDSRVARAYHRYQALLRQANAVDFDDMIGLAVQLLEQEEQLRTRMQRRLRYLLVDEFQDTNIAQLKLVQLVAGPGGNLTAVGDEDQSIYRWRGAEIDNILRFEDVFPGAVAHKLEQNYRSTQNILDASGALVAHNRNRRGKTLWTDRGDGDPIALHYCGDEGDEARWIAGRMHQLHVDHKWTDMAILLRTNAQTRALEDELLRQRIPYCLIAGVRFYERAEVKDLVAYLRVIRNPRDNLSLRRILNQPPRGIGKTTQNAVFEEAEEIGDSIWDVLRIGRLAGVSQRARSALRRFRELIEGLRDLSEQEDLPTLLQALLEQTKYPTIYERKQDPENDAKLENIREFLSAAQEFTEDLGGLGQAARDPSLDNLTTATDPGRSPSPAPRADARQLQLAPGPDTSRLQAASEQPEPSLLDDEVEADPLTMFLDYVSLVSDTDGLESDAGVSVMTLHSAKGLEFPVVFLAGLEDGLLPHFNSQEPEELEEERRLLYVGMTRAEERLHLTSCARRRIAGRYQDQDPSPFLDEIPERNLEISEAQGGSSYGRHDHRLDGVRSFFGGGAPANGGASASGPRGSLDTGEHAVQIRSATPRQTTNQVRRSSRVSPAAPPPGPGVEVRPRMAVRHPTLGKGVVLQVDGEGDNAKITVYFERSGKRRLLAKYAGLQPAESA